jgi:GTP-binding protein EngB required for normal cell division
MDSRAATGLNPSQQHRLVVTCQYIDRLLTDLEEAFTEAQSGSPFGRYTNDLAPAEQRLVRDYIARLRTQLLRILDGQDLPAAPRRTALRWAILTHLAYIDVAVEELGPRYMRGYGAVPPEAASVLDGIVEELHATIGQLTRSLSSDPREDLRARLALAGETAGAALLQTLGEVIATHGLVEFRTALSAILDTLERRGLELAVFGRVNTGKSSLLNRLLERDVLPVGVTPITAVPIRIRFGPEPRLLVSLADGPARELDVSELPAYASERENPGNARRVVRLVVELPAPFLQSGVTLVDTPGLGSLATSGAAETLAYLPQCDVAAVLVDAGSTITGDDLSTVGLLLAAGARVSVLLSKADLLDEPDRTRAVSYVREMLAREFERPIPVAPVSVAPGFDVLFQQWRRSELEPLIADQERERLDAAARKTEILRAQVEAALTRRLQAAQATAADVRIESHGAASMLQTAAGRITTLRRRIEDVAAALPRRAPEIVARAAEAICQDVDPAAGLGRAFQDVAGGTAHEVARELRDLSASLTAAFRQVAEAFAWTAGPPDLLAREARFREMPIPALPEGLEVPDRGVERILGPRLARAIVARRVERAAGGAIRSALESYAAVLRRWALDAIDAIRAEWTAATDALRADLDRRLGHGASAPIDPDVIRRDLERLSMPAEPGRQGRWPDGAIASG